MILVWLRVGVCLFLGAVPAIAAPVTVYSNGPAPGDSFTNAGPSNQGQAVGATGWYYNNVRNNGVAGINTNYPHSGTGSAFLSTTQGPGGASSKADIEFLAQGTNIGGNYFAAGSLGTLGQLSGLSYDWYRDSASTNNPAQSPSLRILLDADGNLATTGDRGALIFEYTYNGGGPTMPTDTWVTNAIGGNSILWNSGLGVGSEFGGYTHTLNDWINGFTVGLTNSPLSANSLVLGISAGVGSGWGPFQGAVDNISFGFDGNINTYNFEVQAQAVPEPASLIAWSLLTAAGAAVGYRRRRK